MSNIDNNHSQLTVNDLWNKKSHYGGKKRFSHPKMIHYISSLERGKYFLDLNKTLYKIDVVTKILKKIDEAGKKILFVATKPKLKGLLSKYIAQTDHFYIDNRWLGGLLTNFEHLQKRILLIQKMSLQEEKGLSDYLTKKEKLLFQRKKDNLALNLQGILEMKKLPDYLFIIDPTHQHIAVSEATKLNIPIFAMLNTSSNPKDIEEIIPINDNSPQVLELVFEHFLENSLSSKKNKTVIANKSFTKEEVVQGVNNDQTN